MMLLVHMFGEDTCNGNGNRLISFLNESTEVQTLGAVLHAKSVAHIAHWRDMLLLTCVIM